MQKKTDGEQGAVMIEATYCIVLAVFVLMFLLSFGFFMYQKTILFIVANEVAEEVAQTYKLRDVADASEVTHEDVIGVGKYRYLLFSGSFESANEIKVKSLANVRLTTGSLAKSQGSLTVTVENVSEDIGRRHYVVTVRQKYSFLLGDLLSLIGQSEVQTLEATAYVEGVDVLNYVNTVKFSKYILSEVTGYSSVLGLANTEISAINGVITTAQKLFDMVKALLGTE